MPNPVPSPTTARLAAGTAALAGLLAPTAAAQSADALLDKLVDKGVLTVDEANELREQSDADFTRAYQLKTGMPDWVGSLRLNGDLRGRFESFHGREGLPDRNRFRYRIRAGMTAVLADQFEVGFRVTSSQPEGNFGGNPISGNTSFSDNASKKFLYVDLAYARWTPLNTADWGGSVTFGKMENPFLTSEAVFDRDYTPEGAAVNLAYNVDDAHVLRLNGGGFVLDEIRLSSQDPYLVGAQVVWEATWDKRWQSQLGVGAYNLINAHQLNFLGTIPTVPNVAAGNLRTGLGAGPGAGGAFVHHYNPVAAVGAVTYTLGQFPAYAGAFPIRLEGDYLYNPGADEENTVWSAGVTLGKAGRRGTWDLSYRWRHVGGDGFYEEFADSNFGAYYPLPPGPSSVTRTAGFNAASYLPGQPLLGAYLPGTNVEGHILRLQYSPLDSVTLAVTWYATAVLLGNPADSSSAINRVLVDASWRF
jgi:hypothetical protein